ncbi:MAG TPA: glycerophosphodiester phosphodiesterase, partial [Chloroflexi bacterium]|nr:glycerophosphodiester phosphodiesterase [Chloroflexota bacterium]
MSQRSWKTDALLMIAHRGASAYAPENTMAAFRLAEAMGADGIEFDVKLTADGVPIVMHDATLDRTTDGSGEVARRTLNEIRKLDAGSFFEDSFAGEKVPTLAEVLETLGPDMLLNIELTNYASPRDILPERSLRIVEEA